MCDSEFKVFFAFPGSPDLRVLLQAIIIVIIVIPIVIIIFIFMPSTLHMLI
jgi:hypothetical protein